MGEISHISINQTRFEPEAVFGHPHDLFADVGLTCGQKLATLARWRQHLIDKLRATGEGMAPAPSDTSSDATMLSEVEKAMRCTRDTRNKKLVTAKPAERSQYP